MNDLPHVGQYVEVSDPLGYSGLGYAAEVQEQPHHSVLVLFETITDRTDQRMVGRKSWVLGGHVKPKFHQCECDYDLEYHRVRNATAGREGTACYQEAAEHWPVIASPALCMPCLHGCTP